MSADVGDDVCGDAGENAEHDLGASGHDGTAGAGGNTGSAGQDGKPGAAGQKGKEDD